MIQKVEYNPVVGCGKRGADHRGEEIIEISDVKRGEEEYR
jgi:hypothetical protein